MPIYDYRCKNCESMFDVTRSIADCDQMALCPNCSHENDRNSRIISRPKEFFGEKPEEPFFSLPLGKWVKGKSDLRRQAKELGMIEVGSENVDNIIKRDERYIAQKCESRYNSLFESYNVRG